MKVHYSLIIALLLGATLVPSPGQEYPKPVGNVNDFANLLNKEQTSQLTSELRDFERHTSNEVIVVTVSSLGGATIESYTLGLFNTWGVGKRESNNGVMLLIAPNERKVRITVGRGLENRLTDSVANRIIQNEILPQFRAKHMDLGIIAGTRSIFRTLEPVAKTIAAEEPVRAPVIQEATAGKISSRGIKVLFWTIGILVVIGLGTLIAHLLVGDHALQNSNQIRIGDLSLRFAKLGRNVSDAKRDIEKVEKYSPSRYSSLLIKISKVNLPILETQLREVKGNVEAGRSQAKRAEKALNALAKNLRSAEGIVDGVEQGLEEIMRAQTEGPKLLKRLDAGIASAQKKQGGMKAGQLAALDQARAKYSQAHVAASSDGDCDWLLVYSLLLTAQQLFNSSQESHHVQSGSRGENNGRSDDQDSVASHSPPSSSSSASPSYDSSPPSFGGGVSDGGGATGSW